nr:type I secretion C-terminal target domain-containing protein [Cytophagales bacterium]
MGIVNFNGVETNISETISNPFLGNQILEINGVYFINAELLDGGSTPGNILIASSNNQYIRLEDNTGKLLLSNFDVILLGGGDDIINLASRINHVSNLRINTGSGNNIVWSGAGDDEITALDGDDILHGGPGHDIINSGGGNDVITGGQGNDTINAGDGFDTVIYSGSYYQYQIINKADQIFISNLKGLDGSDIVTGAERFQFDDGIFENGVFTPFINDQIFIATVDAEIFEGTELGFDTVDYSFSASGVYVDLEDPSLVFGGHANGDRLISIEAIIGSGNNDRLYGNEADNILDGGSRNDYLNGRSGDDTLYGGHGEDILVGGKGSDTLYGGAGDDVLHGNGIENSEIQNVLNGFSGAVFNENLNSFYFFAPTLGVSWDLLAAVASTVVFNGVGAHIANITSAEEYNYINQYIGNSPVWLGGSDVAQEGQWTWSAGAEEGSIFYDNSLVNVNSYKSFFSGQPFFASAGDEATDALIMWSPYSWIDYYAAAPAGIVAEWDAGAMNDDNAVDRLFGGDGNDTLYGYGGHDELHGDRGNDLLYGGNGDDLLYGGEEIDNLYGQAGNDTLKGGAGSDLLVGGQGADTFVIEYGYVDTIVDFSLSENDVLDISNIIFGYNPLTSLISDFVRIEDDGSNSNLYVDINGGGNNFVQVATLLNVSGIDNVEDLEASGNIIV